MSSNNYSPEHKARELLHSFGILKPPINPYNICSRLNIKISHAYFDKANAFFTLKNGVKEIILNHSINYSLREKFTIAHEIGHYWLNHGQITACPTSDIMNYESNEKIELEADRFAAELLMPSFTFAEDVDKLPLSIRSFKILAKKYKTSLTSTAIKFIENTKFPGAIFLSSNGKISLKFKSNKFNYTLRHNDELNPHSYAYDYFIRNIDPPNAPVRVCSDAWLDDENAFHSFTEHSFPYRNFNQVLTLIQHN
ncbi:MAG: hypothetical protein AWU54_1788 [Candidatus Frackibacter sp. T328-2]|nr:MAG: hypothetical protein AWU54_1788 [Candidatus Frackibacter sp. T328-2]